MNFQKNQYTCFVYEDNNGRIDIADGNILETSIDRILLAYENFRGPTTPTRVPFNKVIEVIE